MTKTFSATASELGEKLNETVSDAQAAIEGLGRAAGDQLNQARHETAGSLHSAASSVRNTGRRSSTKIGKFSSDAADNLDAAGAYVEDDMRFSVAGLQRFGRRHPEAWLLAGAAIGMVVGSFMNRTKD